MGDPVNGTSRRDFDLPSVNGGAAPLLLGTALLLLVGIATTGGLELMRVTGARVLAHRSIQAAVSGAAETLTFEGPAAAEQAFWNLLRENLDLDMQMRPRAGDLFIGAVEAQVLILPEGGHDPLTGRRWQGPAVAGKVGWHYRPLFPLLGQGLLEARYAVRAP